jgi:YgiT-type zinc finger domain-containing protein
MVRVVGDVEFRVGKKRVRLSDVAHERCLKCGERVFDLATNRRLDAAAGLRGVGTQQKGEAERKAISRRAHL